VNKFFYRCAKKYFIGNRPLEVLQIFTNFQIAEMKFICSANTPISGTGLYRMKSAINPNN